jgi:hypothetical protein
MGQASRCSSVSAAFLRNRSESFALAQSQMKEK